MARYGYCSDCGAAVWLTPEGGCANGHGPECLSNVVEQDDSAPVQDGASIPYAVPPVPEPEPKKSKTGLIIGIVIGVLLLCVCAPIGGCALLGSMGLGAAIPVFDSAKDDAEMRSCYANQRTMEGGYQVWRVDNPDSKYPFDYQEFTDALVPEYLASVPVCPAGGSYDAEWGGESIAVYCDIHGNYEDAGGY